MACLTYGSAVVLCQVERYKESYIHLPSSLIETSAYRCGLQYSTSVVLGSAWRAQACISCRECTKIDAGMAGWRCTCSTRRRSEQGQGIQDHFEAARVACSPTTVSDPEAIRCPVSELFVSSKACRGAGVSCSYRPSTSSWDWAQTTPT